MHAYIMHIYSYIAMPNTYITHHLQRVYSYVQQHSVEGAHIHSYNELYIAELL